MAARTFERTSLVPAGIDEVWARVVTPEGINDEMRPWMTMTRPRGTDGLTVETVPVGRPLGRAWLRLLGVVPFDYDHLTIAELEPGRRFHEVSTMLSMRRWEHERMLTAVGEETEVRDRITFEPRLPVPGLAALLALVLRTFFGHRHRRLNRHFSAR